MPFIHLKDYAMTLERKPSYCEIGLGTLPFKRIIEEAERSGCQWFIVEQDTCPGDPFESLRGSYNYLKANFIS
jgi:sugar phosphate isomerase/epimerase